MIPAAGSKRLFGAMLAALGILASVVVMTTLPRADRGGRQTLPASEKHLEAQMLKKLQRLPRFTAAERRADHAVLGDHRPVLPSSEARRNLIETAAGWIDPKNPGELLGRLPADLRGGGRGVVDVAGKGRLLETGVNILQIEQGALRDRGIAAIRDAIGAAGGHVLDTLPSRGLVVRTSRPGAGSASC